MAKLDPSDRGPLIISAGIAMAGLFIALAIFLSRGGGNAPAGVPSPYDPRASVEVAAPTPTIDPTAADQATIAGLREVANAATSIGVPAGDFAQADILMLGKRAEQFTYLPSTRPSNRPNEISVSSQSASWAAASQSESGTCFWIKLTLDTSKGEAYPTYGAGSPCTGAVAQSASQAVFPGL